MDEIGHQHIAVIKFIGAAGSRYQSISDLTQHMNEWNEAWPQHRELHALLFMNSVWVLLRPTGLWTLKGCETGPTVYSPHLRRHESLNHLCTCNYKGSTFSSIILRPWVLVRLESNSRPPAWQPNAQPTEPSVHGKKLLLLSCNINNTKGLHWTMFCATCLAMALKRQNY